MIPHIAEIITTFQPIALLDFFVIISPLYQFHNQEEPHSEEKMNAQLAELIKLYATDSHINFNAKLLSLSKDSLIAMFSDILTMYINDKNSSTQYFTFQSTIYRQKSF